MAKLKEDKYNQLYEQYMTNRETEQDATEMADERIGTYNRRKIGDMYVALLENY